MVKHLKIETVAIETVKPNPNNPRTITPENKALLVKSIKDFPQMLELRPLVVDKKGVILGGNMRYDAAIGAGLKKIPIIRAESLTPAQAKEFVVKDNVGLGEWEWEALLEQYSTDDLQEWGLDVPGVDDAADSGTGEKQGNASLSDEFGVPPFTVLNAREGWWQERKRAWLELGIKSEVGRGDNETGAGTVGGNGASLGAGLQARKGADGKLEYVNIHAGRSKAYGIEGNISEATGTSIFDPTLTELCYRWFSPVGGLILDPFAGGSVRGIVASHVGRQYVGVELRKEQVDANNEQQHISLDPKPVWTLGDSRNITSLCAGVQADMVFSCPPYADLEVYSDDPNDLSTLAYTEFRAAYIDIINKTCSLLKPDRFACFVVGEVRDKRGNYYNFVGDTISAFRAAGLEFYNEAILVTAIGSLPIRAGRAFRATRKMGKTHQNVLVFVKGDGKRAAKACGDCAFGEIGDDAVGLDT